MYLPKQTEPDSATLALERKAAVNLVIYNGNNLYAYQGTDYLHGKVYKTGDSISLKQYLLQVKSEVGDSNFVVVLRPDSTASYKGTVEALDVMTINDIKRYAMVDPMETDKIILDSLRK